MWKHKKAKAGRNAKKPGARLKQIEVGTYVRIALTPKIKGAAIEQKGPKPKWSGKSYEVVKRSKTDMYTLSGLPKRRFSRYM